MQFGRSVALGVPGTVKMFLRDCATSTAGDEYTALHRANLYLFAPGKGPFIRKTVSHSLSRAAVRVYKQHMWKFLEFFSVQEPFPAALYSHAV